MSDDRFSKMLNDARSKSDARDAQAKAAKEKLVADTQASGVVLKERLMPRVLEAQKAWEGKLKLEITDNSEKFDVSSDRSRSYPSITIALMAKQRASFVFETFSPGYVAIREGLGPNKGNSVYEFEVKELKDLTNQKIDDILQVLVNEAHGIKSRR